MSYATQRDAGVRTPQQLVVVGVPQCANFYASRSAGGLQGEQGLKWTEDFSNVLWIKTNATITTNTAEAPDGETTADTIDFTAATGSVEMIGDYSLTGATGDGYTGSVWIKATGAGTVTLMIRKSAGVEETTSIVNVTTSWVRLSMAALSASNGGNYRFLITRAVGDLAQVIVWGANMSRIGADYPPTAAGHVFPYVKRETETVQTESVKSSPCSVTDAGVGARCYYTFASCQDVENYNDGNSYEATAALRGIKEFRFCRKDSPLAVAGAEVMPLLESAAFTPQKIDTEKAVTQSERIKFKFSDHTATWNWNQDKVNEGAKTNTGTPSGTFWTRFMRLHRNYANPKGYAKLYAGFVESGGTEADYEARGKYIIKNLALSSGFTMTMECADRLKLLKAKAPPKISETNLINGAITSGATSMVVDDATEITDPGDGYNVCLQLTYSGTDEFVNVTAKSGNTLTIQRGRWGTAAAAHADNAVFREVLQFGTENPTPASPPMGKKVVDIVKELAFRAGFTADEVDEVTLDFEGDTWLTGEISGTTETGILFKRCGDTVGSGNGAIIDQHEIEYFIRQIRESSLLDLWTNQEQMLTGSVFAPALPTETLNDLTETDDILVGSVNVDDREDTRVSRVIIGYDLQAGKNGDRLSDYGKFVARVDGDAENPNSYGEARTKVVLSPWIKTTDSSTASTLAAHILARFKAPVREVEFDLELRHDDTECGEYVTLTTSRIVQPDGTTDPQRVMQIVKKSRDETRGRLGYVAVDTSLGQRYAFIAPDANADEYDNATPDERRHAYIASDDGTIPTAGDPGYAIW